MDIDFDWEEIFDLFKNMKVEKKYAITEGKVNPEKIEKILVDEHNFSLERVKTTLRRLMKAKEEKKQSGLNEWFS